ncbi:hypothetical protein MN2019_11960 [Mycolicibacterium neoaurum]|uniref:hypothetical protein n=1 Tax=Mycolicibacterium neoaurum TaxID=1795 RepID=UPI001BCE4464|nr:hypothetical protein [Mycolicibacterium neoaurum]QVI29937.1 hypothetical protein MN2019_11960 [Mycolicibacterium neoaurum]
MRIRHGHTIEVHRSVSQDRHGDTTRTLIGTIDHVVFQERPNTQPGKGFSEIFSTDMVVFCPTDAPIRLQARDRIKCAGIWYAVIGSPIWDDRHPFTGNQFDYYAMQIESTS